MKIEIRATYPATDGSMPEDVTVEIADVTEPVPTAEMGALIGDVLDRHP